MIVRARAASAQQSRSSNNHHVVSRSPVEPARSARLQKVQAERLSSECALVRSRLNIIFAAQLKWSELVALRLKSASRVLAPSRVLMRALGTHWQDRTRE